MKKFWAMVGLLALMVPLQSSTGRDRADVDEQEDTDEQVSASAPVPFLRWLWPIVLLLAGLAALAGIVVAILRVVRRTAQQPDVEQVPSPDGAGYGAAAIEDSAETVGEKDISDEPPPPPDPVPLTIFTRAGEGTAQEQRLWLTLQQESYRQRGSGFRTDWAFPQYASKHNLGAPLERSSRLAVQEGQYALQPFAGDTIFNEVPHWSDVRSLNSLIGESIPESGLARELLNASYQLSGSMLRPDWAFHQMAVREQLGPAMSGNYRITVGEHEYSLQVFAGDTLYSQVPNWSSVQRLSETEAGTLSDALWRETYKVSDSPYQSDSPAHQFAIKHKLGTPLSGVYKMDFEGNQMSVQVFAKDTIFTDQQGRFNRQSDLAKPEQFATSSIPAETGSQDDAMSSKRPTFAMLPIAGSPPISQLYGYTKWSAGGGRQFYTATQGRHPGIDFAVPVGTPMIAIAHGLVVWAGTGSPFASGPRSIVVRYGSIYAIYGHASSEVVSRGQFVSPGQLVGYSGTLGGPHLHFELREVPARVLNNQDPNQPPVNPGFTFNPIEAFSPEMVAYFEAWYQRLGGDSHFCRGSFRDQERIQFGGAVDYRPCTN